MVKTKSKPKYENIPGVPGCVYYITIEGSNRTLMCVGNVGRKVILHDLSTGYKREWDIAHFSFMLRKNRWRDPHPGGDLPEKLTIEHTQKKDEIARIKTRDYSKEDLNELVDDIDNVEF
mgnify:FL=1